MSIKQQEIILYENKIDFRSIIESSEPSLLKLKSDDYDSLYDYLTACATNYLKICYPNQIHLAPVMASDIIETRPSWKAADGINLFKFLRQRQDLEGIRVYGNQLTMPKFMEMVSVYEEERAQELEKFHAKNKGEIVHNNKQLNELAEATAKKILEKNGKYKQGDEVMTRDFKRVQLERIESGKDGLFPKQNHQDFFQK